MWRQFAPQEKTPAPFTSKGLGLSVPGIRQDNQTSQAFEGLLKVASNAAQDFNRHKAVDGQMSERAAENWMKGKSPEEYRKALQDGQVPFQEDPVAMARLRYLHGYHSSIAVQNQVAANVDGGAYRDEMDAKGNVIRSASQIAVEDYHTRLKGMREELTGTLGFDPEDEAFSNGMFRDSDKALSTITAYQTRASDKRNRMQAQVLHRATRNALIPQAMQEGSDVAVAQAVDSWQVGYETGVYKDLGDTLKDVGDTLSTVGSRPGGLEVIDKLLDSKVPGTENTVRDFYDQDELETFRQKALTSETTQRAGAELDWQVKVQEAQDDPNGLTWLYQSHSEELKRSGGTDTPRASQLVREITSKKAALAREAERTAKENAKLYTQSARVAVLTGEAMKFIGGDRAAQSYGVMPADPELGKYTKEDALVMERALLERYQSKPDKLLKLADYMPNGYIANTIKDYWKDTSATMAIDASRIAQGTLRPDDIKEPETLQSVQLLKDADPLAFRKVIGGDVDALAKMDTLDTLKVMGMGYKDMVLAESRMVGMDKKTRDGQLNKIKRTLMDEAVAPKHLGKAANLKNLAGSPYAQTYMKTMVNGLLAVGIPDEEAYKRADSAFAQSHVGLNGFPIPTGFFSAIKAEDQVNTGLDLLGETLVNYASSQGVREQDVIPEFDSQTQTVYLRAPGKPPVTIRSDLLQEGAEALTDKRRQEALKANAEAAEAAASTVKTRRTETRTKFDQLETDLQERESWRPR
ncbi:hypothetical protein DBR00_02445 [Pseudomonas sp. HMWF032]|nr:hypothetical protein DBR00_02445 [Pseudomonas sp. HMWF032]PTT81377.1 hypothetical protein DBR41_17085 [Pseudomonas sp. HMWF010]